MLLECGEKLLGFGQRQAKVLDTLAVLLEDSHLLHLFLTTIVCTDHELHLQLHWGILHSGVIRMEGLFYPRMLGLPSFLMLSVIEARATAADGDEKAQQHAHRGHDSLGAPDP